MILAITTGLTNACSEGYNRIVKRVGRVAFGFRNPPTNDAGYGGPALAEHGRRRRPAPNNYVPAKEEPRCPPSPVAMRPLGTKSIGPHRHSRT